jgi:hypothetical protein
MDWYFTNDARSGDRVSRFLLHDAGYFGVSHPVHAADHAADFSGYSFGLFFISLRIRQLQLDFDVNMGPRHFPMIR